MVSNLKSKNKLIGAYGCCKGNTLLNCLGMNSKIIFAVADNSETKVNHYTPEVISRLFLIIFLKTKCNYALL